MRKGGYGLSWCLSFYFLANKVMFFSIFPAVFSDGGGEGYLSLLVGKSVGLLQMCTRVLAEGCFYYNKKPKINFGKNEISMSKLILFFKAYIYIYIVSYDKSHFILH